MRTYFPSRALEAITAHCMISYLLYSHIIFHDGNSHILRDPELLALLITNLRLNCTKALSFRLIEGSWAIGNHNEVGRLVDAPGYGRLGDMRAWAGVYNDSVAKIASSTPRLHRFEWQNWPISQALLETLKGSCPLLQDVSVVYPNLAKLSRTERFYRHEASTFEEVKPRLLPLPTPEFQNMRKLHLYEITGNLDIWITKIASMLGKSRLLEELGLSLSAECERQYALAGKSSDFLNFFVALVERYRDQGDEPLKLRILKLGYGVLLNTPPGTRQNGSLEQADYLSDITNKAYLEELYIDNDLDVGCPLNIRNITGQISWSTITPSFLPSLKRFTFTSLTERSREWLVAHPDSTFAGSLSMGVGTERLAYSCVDDEGAVHRVLTHKIQGSIGQIGDRTFFLERSSERPSLPLRSTTLFVLKPSNRVDLSVLGGCPWIETLAICLPKQTLTTLLKKIMQRIPPTKHLWIRIGMDYPLLNAQDEASHRGNAIRMGDGSLVDEQLFLYNMWREKWTEMAGAVADTKTCPSKYLKIGHLAWLVLHRVEGGKRCAELVPLDMWQDEAEGPSVFRYTDPVRRDRPY